MPKRKAPADSISKYSMEVPKNQKLSQKSPNDLTSQPLPSRNMDNELQFADYPDFKPNLTPKEVLQLGSFGGTYFRTIKSNVTNQTHTNAWKEFPESWFEGLNINSQVASQTYNANLNKYKVECGNDLDFWEKSGWIMPVDPFGWFQWYCRFYQGRRCSDDQRPISRGLGVMGPKGRWRNFLVNKCLNSGLSPEQAIDDATISPKVRQLLQHWGYKLTLKDLLKIKKK